MQMKHVSFSGNMMLPIRLARMRIMGYNYGEKGRTLRFFANAMIWKNIQLPATLPPLE